MMGVIQAVIHIKCFQREGWKKVGYYIKSQEDTILRVWISSCLSATFVFISPVVDLCVMHVKGHTDESRGSPRGPPSKPGGFIATYPTEPRATVWLVCAIGLASLLYSPPIPVL